MIALIFAHFPMQYIEAISKIVWSFRSRQSGRGIFKFRMFCMFEDPSFLGMTAL